MVGGSGRVSPEHSTPHVPSGQTHEELLAEMDRLADSAVLAVAGLGVEYVNWSAIHDARATRAAKGDETIDFRDTRRALVAALDSGFLGKSESGGYVLTDSGKERLVELVREEANASQD